MLVMDLLYCDKSIVLAVYLYIEQLASYVNPLYEQACLPRALQNTQ
jgi:hypothetical protein